MFTKQLKVTVSENNYLSVESLAKDSLMTKSDIVNMILDDFFLGTNNAKILQNILIEDKIER